MNQQKTAKTYFISETASGCIAAVAAKLQTTESEALEEMLKGAVKEMLEGKSTTQPKPSGGCSTHKRVFVNDY